MQDSSTHIFRSGALFQDRQIEGMAGQGGQKRQALPQISRGHRQNDSCQGELHLVPALTQLCKCSKEVSIQSTPSSLHSFATVCTGSSGAGGYLFGTCGLFSLQLERQPLISGALNVDDL